MTERIHKITGAICRQADGPRADGKKPESKERLGIEYSIRLDKNRTNIISSKEKSWTIP